MIVYKSKVISLSDHKTTIRMTNLEWKILDHICDNEKIKRKHLIELIKNERSTNIGLTPAIRLFALVYLYKQTSPAFILSDEIRQTLDNIR